MGTTWGKGEKKRDTRRRSAFVGDRTSDLCTKNGKKAQAPRRSPSRLGEFRAVAGSDNDRSEVSISSPGKEALAVFGNATRGKGALQRCQRKAAINARRRDLAVREDLVVCEEHAAISASYREWSNFASPKTIALRWACVFGASRLVNRSASCHLVGT